MSRNFKYLDDLIQRKDKKIVLDFDIELTEDEELEYWDGIKLDKDVLIDGKGHRIDACGKARIFDCSGKHIRLKNIILKNGKAINGGAIKISKDSNLEIIESKFIYNIANGTCNEGNGGAILNKGNLKLLKSTFENNMAKGEGGAIRNYGKLNIAESIFNKNKAKRGAAIINRNDLTISKTIFDDNTAEWYGGAIFHNWGQASILESEFINNSVTEDHGNGGAICNWMRSQLNITKSSFKQNISGSAGAIYNASDCKLNISQSAFKENSARYAGAIVNYGKASIQKSVFGANKSNKFEGGAIFNYSEGNLIISQSVFESNISERVGGAIYSENDNSLKLNNCKFKHNKPDNFNVGSK